MDAIDLLAQQIATAVIMGDGTALARASAELAALEVASPLSDTAELAAATGALRAVVLAAAEAAPLRRALDALVDDQGLVAWRFLLRIDAADGGATIRASELGVGVSRLERASKRLVALGLARKNTVDGQPVWLPTALGRLAVHTGTVQGILTSRSDPSRRYARGLD